MYLNQITKSLIHQTELDYISRCIQDCPNLEIGGDLFGFYTTTGIPVVQLATGPGPKAKQNAHSFYQDEDYLIQVGNELRVRFGIQHIGEWHSHHQLELNTPSAKDSAVVAKAIETYQLPSFLLVIGNYSDEGTSINGFRYFDNHNTYVETKWIVLSERSLVRQQWEASKWFELYQPKSEMEKIIDLKLTTLNQNQEFKLPDEHWLQEEDTKLALNELYEYLKSHYQKANLIQDILYHDVHFEFEDTNDSKYLINFPDDFPFSPPYVALEVDKGEHVISTSSLQWKHLEALGSQMTAIVEEGVLELKQYT
jgi:cupin superfamily acireductone dioxygenase involved in methionine salvage